ncbi:MAG TPA: potassium-transporting ATPase subunit KdpB, partial [Bordetella sp.]|nr:potassium-transporting ATPase subunit KdpB [Bordetella sp.]
MSKRHIPAWSLRAALRDTLRKLAPAAQFRNPVMFVVYLGSILTTALGLAALHQSDGAAAFTLGIAAWLWFTVLFANFAEAVAEGRGKQQAAALRGLRTTVPAYVIDGWDEAAGPDTWRQAAVERASGDLRTNDVVLVETGQVIPGDGEVVAGIASVDESAITGESAPVIRESGGDFSSVTGGTRVLSDWLVVRIAADPGQGFLDRMISMVEGARRQKTPNELALTILLVGLTLVFLLVVVTLLPFSLYSVEAAGGGAVVGLAVLVALLVCLIPTTIGGLLSAIGVAGMSRMMRANVVATSGRAVEAAGDVDVLLLDKTGTITFGNRQASAFLPAPGVTVDELAAAALLASLADDTPEGRSIVALAQRPGQAGQSMREAVEPVPFSAQTRMSGVDMGARRLRKGAVDAIAAWLAQHGGALPDAVARSADDVARRGSTPLAVSD